MRPDRGVEGRSDWVQEVGHELVVVEQAGASCWDRFVSLVVFHDPGRGPEVYHETSSAVEWGIAPESG